MKHQRLRQPKYVYGDLLTANPRYPDLFSKIVETLISHDGIYSPEYIEFAAPHRHEVIPFSPSAVDQLYKEWKNAADPSVFGLKRRNPVEAEVTLAKGSLNPFEGPLIHVELTHFQSSHELDELLSVLKDLYSTLQPAYGFVRTYEMARRINERGKEWSPGINLKRGLPDIYWANFLGPEYVEMFGQEALSSFPFHKVEKLSDGGALMILSPSLLDFESDPDGFEKLRLEAKRHLGMDAFDTGDRNFRGRTPRFRFLDERVKAKASVKPISIKQSDLLSTVPRHEWTKWLKEVQSLSLDLVHETETQGIELDYSSDSLIRLDNYVDSQRSKPLTKIEILMKVAAYVSEVIIRSTKANWSFTDSQETPVLVLGNIQLSPLARAQKVLFEGEKFEPWYRYFVEEQTAKGSSGKSS